MRLAILMIGLSVGSASAAALADDPYHLSELERAACTDDAIRLCSSAYPDQHKLLTCMKANRASLSAICLPVFDAGMKKRHL